MEDEWTGSGWPVEVECQGRERDVERDGESCEGVEGGIVPWFGDALEVVCLDVAWIFEASHLVL